MVRAAEGDGEAEVDSEEEEAGAEEDIEKLRAMARQTLGFSEAFCVASQWWEDGIRLGCSKHVILDTCV